jgi:hypothetical protein
MNKVKLAAGLAGMAALIAVMVITGCSGPQEKGDLPGVLTPPDVQIEGMATTGSVDIGVAPLSDQEQVDYLTRAAAEEQGFKIAASRILNVRFAPQVPPGSWPRTMSCGPAALNLDCAYLWGVIPDQVVFIRRINQYLHKADIDNCLPGGTSTSDLVRAAKAVNNCPNTYQASGWTLQRIRQEIDAGRPVVVAVRAGALPNRGYSYTRGHFVLVVGYENGSMVCHDPGTTRGAFKRYSNGNFTTAMSSSGGAVVVARR